MGEIAVEEIVLDIVSAVPIDLENGWSKKNERAKSLKRGLG